MATVQYPIGQTLTVFTTPTSVPELLAYRCQLEDHSDGSVKVWEDFCRVGGEPTPKDQTPRALSTKPEGYWALVSDALLSDMARWGWTGEDDDYAHWKALVSETPYTDLTTSTSDMALVLVEHSSHMFFDAELQPLPVAQRVSYLGWNFDNHAYDLDKAFPILAERPDVKDLSRDRIPSYNCDEERTETLNFWWTPSVEDYRRVWAECLNTTERHPSVRWAEAAFTVDVFGLRAAGAARSDSYYGK
jgi:hypothetical protein